MKLGKDRQLTIPLDLADRFGWEDETELELVPSATGILVRTVHRVREAGEVWRDPVTGKTHEEMTPQERGENVRRWIKKSAGSMNSGLTGDQIMAMTRGEE